MPTAHTTRERTVDRPLVRFPVDQHRRQPLLATPVMAEVYVSHLLDRDEFRRHCDRYQTLDRILANLR
jgi:hypothetical protein